MFFLSLRYLGNRYLKNTNSDADLFVFLTGNYKYGVGGAWRGTLCSYKQDRISISQYDVDDMYTAEVRSFLNLVYPMNLSTVFPHIAAAATILFWNL